MELNFEGFESLEMKKKKIDIAQRWEKSGHLSSYHIDSWSYGHKNGKNGSFLYFLLMTAKN